MLLSTLYRSHLKLTIIILRSIHWFSKHIYTSIPTHRYISQIHNFLVIIRHVLLNNTYAMWYIYILYLYTVRLSYRNGFELVTNILYETARGRRNIGKKTKYPPKWMYYILLMSRICSLQLMFLISRRYKNTYRNFRAPSYNVLRWFTTRKNQSTGVYIYIYMYTFFLQLNYTLYQLQ